MSTSLRFLLGLCLGLLAAATLRAQEPAAFFPVPLPSPEVQRLPPVDPPNGLADSPADRLEDVPGELLVMPPGGIPRQPGVDLPLLEDELPIKSWEGSVELGLDGASGNSDSMNLHAGFHVKRSSPWNGFTFDVEYRKQTAQQVETANRMFSESRFEQFFLGTRWTCFVHGTVDYDNFTSYDARITSDLGIGYKLLDGPATKLTSRSGAGVSHKIGGPDQSYVPEAVFGLDFEHRMSSRQKLTARADYMPDVTEFSHYRINSQAAWELLVDQATNLSLKFGVLDRYDSTPQGKKPNDLNYSAMLLWKF